MKKKVLALLLTAALSVTMLAGCGEKTSVAPAANGGDNGAAATEVQKVTLKVWAPEEDMEITYDMCDKFQAAHPEFEITWDLAVTGVDESGNNLTTDPDAAADVFLMPSGSIPELVNAGLLLPITADIENVKALYSEGAINACSRDGFVYGVPSTPNSWFMYYNKSLYTEDEVQSLETMMAKDLGDGIANFSCTITNSWYIEAFFYAAGCTLFGPDGTDAADCTWNNEAGLEVGKYLIDLTHNPKYLEDQDGVAGARMKEGTLAALCSGTWAAESVKEALGDNYAAVELPTVTINGKTAHLSNFADYKCYGVKSNTQYPLAAQLFAEFLSNEENQLIRYEKNNTTPTCLSLQDNPALQEDQASLALLAQTQYSTPQPAIAQISQYWTPAQALGTGIFDGTITEANLQESLDACVLGITSTLTE
jgi:arabinogalactan oligomer/maltooligosaccharide transport system substrate-binding protein